MFTPNTFARLSWECRSDIFQDLVGIDQRPYPELGEN